MRPPPFEVRGRNWTLYDGLMLLGMIRRLGFLVPSRRQGGGLRVVEG